MVAAVQQRDRGGHGFARPQGRAARADHVVYRHRLGCFVGAARGCGRVGLVVGFRLRCVRSAIRLGSSVNCPGFAGERQKPGTVQ